MLCNSVWILSAGYVRGNLSVYIVLKAFYWIVVLEKLDFPEMYSFGMPSSWILRRNF